MYNGGYSARFLNVKIKSQDIDSGSCCFRLLLCFGDVSCQYSDHRNQGVAP